MALRAIAFDYGMVLSGPQDPEAHQQLKALSGLPHKDFERFYWADRHAYDRGELTGIAFWEKFVQDAKLDLTSDQVAHLNRFDAHMWTTTNPAMLAWHQVLRQRGLKTGILSNMGDNVLESLEANFPWLNDFDVLIWSYQHNLAKPEPEIYHLLLERLGTAPEETLFLDDKLINIEAARHLGLQALQFSTVEQLRQDLITAGLDQELPLP